MVAYGNDPRQTRTSEHVHLHRGRGWGLRVRVRRVSIIIAQLVSSIILVCVCVCVCVGMLPQKNLKFTLCIDMPFRTLVVHKYDFKYLWLPIWLARTVN